MRLIFHKNIHENRRIFAEFHVLYRYYYIDIDLEQQNIRLRPHHHNIIWIWHIARDSALGWIVDE